MCQDALHKLLMQVPKCEHHVHLEGALTPGLFLALFTRHNASLQAESHIYASLASLRDHYSSPDACPSQQDFWTRYSTGLHVLRTTADFRDLGMEYFQKAADCTVRHAEVSFDAQAHTSRGIDFRTVINGLKSACADAQAEYGMSSCLILCFRRDLPLSSARETYDAAREHLLDGTIAGIGLHGPGETEYPPELFQEIFHQAEKDGVRRTAHAGETAGPETITAALSSLKAQRIDHWRTLPSDKKLLERIVRGNHLLTACPVSNVRLLPSAGVEAVWDLPIRPFLDSGVCFSINSDYPALLGGAWVQEGYCAVQHAFGLKFREWESVCLASIEGSWCSEERKMEIACELLAVLEGWADGLPDLPEATKKRARKRKVLEE